MRHLDEGTIHAWLDGALDAAEAAHAEAHVAECAECAARVAEARGLIAASSRILSALDDVPVGVVPPAAGGAPSEDRGEIAPIPVAPRRRSWVPRASWAAAAVLLIALTTVVVEQTQYRPMVASTRAVAADEAEASASARNALDTSHAPVFAAPPQGLPLPSPSRATAPRAMAKEGRPGARAETSESDGPRIAALEGKEARAPQLQRAEKDEQLRQLADTLSIVSSVPTGAAQGFVLTDSVSANRMVVRADSAAIGAASGRAAGAAAQAVSAETILLPAPPRLVGRDTTVLAADERIVRSTYEVRPGVMVVLVDRPEREALLESAKIAAADQRLRQAESPVRRRAQPSAAPAPPSAPSAPATTITWTERGRRYELTGPLTEAELQALRARLP